MYIFSRLTFSQGEAAKAWILESWTHQAGHLWSTIHEVSTYTNPIEQNLVFYSQCLGVLSADSHTSQKLLDYLPLLLSEAVHYKL